MSKSDGMAPGLSPEDQARARAAMENLRRTAARHSGEDRQYGSRDQRRPSGIDADGEEEEDDVND